MSTSIRPATPQDAEGILAIYAPIISETAISFEFEPPTVAEMQQRIADTLAQFPWLVCDRQGEILGYVYASKHRARAAYQWAVDVSVYVRSDQHRSGIGRGLYTALFELLKQQGACSLFAGITLPNPGSVGLHESLGFQPLGIYRNVGHKFDAWHDVGWWQLSLQSDSYTPKPIIPFTDLERDAATLEAAWRAGLPLIRV